MHFHVPVCVSVCLSVFRAVPVPATATSSSLIYREVINECTQSTVFDQKQMFLITFSLCDAFYHSVPFYFFSSYYICLSSLLSPSVATLRLQV